MKHINVILLLAFYEFTYLECLQHLGMLSPIELVEEWGCQDTEIRLTCGHLESKLAILEATFSPNCSHENCDMKRLVRTFIPPEENDLKMAEQEAGRKFLETLRRTHLQNDDADVDEDEIEMESNFDDELQEKAAMYEYRYSNWNSSVSSTGDESSNTSSGQKSHAQVTSSKRKRTSLRIALERLIIRYLRKLSFNEHGDDGDGGGRFARSRRRRIAVAATTMARTTEYEPASKGGKVSNKSNSREDAYGVSTDNDNDDDDDEISSAEDLARIQDTRSYCNEQKRQISSLDKNDLLRSYQNESEDEYNIRRVVNNRCSGKNHCSFIFSIDHPFARIWNSGIVRLKYICMEEFRTNRYCGEHFTIDYEVDPKVQVMESMAEGGGPVAESRIQARETALHSLKILRPDKDQQHISPDDSTYASLPSNQSKKRRIKVEPPSSSVANHEEKSSSVYSQDFRVLKILPNNLDDFDDQIGDEIYIRKIESETNQIETSTRKDEITAYQEKLPPTRLEDNASKHYRTPIVEQLNSNDNGNDGNLSKYDDVTLTIRNGGQYVVVYPYALDINRTSNTVHPENLKRKNSTSFTSTTATNTKTIQVTSSTTSGTRTVPIPIVTTLLTPVEGNETENNAIEDENFSEKNSKIIPTATVHSHDEIDGPFTKGNIEKNSKSRSDFSEYNRKNNIHRNFYRSPLLHGFAMTPGYPKFYIGESECKWNVMVPGGLQIRVTILDISLRYEEICKDFIRIDDLGINRTLFNSCTESIRPIEVVSSTNWIEIVVKTTTKVAYPKRGVLLHYMAFGCVTPPLPKFARLVERTETTALYQCEQSFVFPDTGISTRKLICNNRDLWNKLLPDCIEKEHFQARIANPPESNTKQSKNHKYSHIQNLTRKTNNNSEMDKSEETSLDMVYDVIIPIIIVISLFIINGFVLMYIIRARRRLIPEENVELTRL